MVSHKLKVCLQNMCANTLTFFLISISYLPCFGRIAVNVNTKYTGS